MQEAKVRRTIDAHAGTSFSNIDDFSEFLELQATRMELSGFMSEATNLRKWAAELNNKSLEVSRSVEIE
ncbi:MAG: hypothetical protein LLG06_16790 [Desulfobacteraceae bacterium]|nr:hypothetical protein [Desulfobacteraceae bacterium]